MAQSLDKINVMLKKNKKINPRKVFKNKEVIKPEVKICVNCKKNNVTDHHWLCNSCYSKKTIAKDREKSSTLVKQDLRRRRPNWAQKNNI